MKREDEQAFALLNGQNLMFCEDAARRMRLEFSCNHRIIKNRNNREHVSLKTGFHALGRLMFHLFIIYYKTAARNINAEYYFYNGKAVHCLAMSCRILIDDNHGICREAEDMGILVYHVNKGPPENGQKHFSSILRNHGFTHCSSRDFFQATDAILADIRVGALKRKLDFLRQFLPIDIRDPSSYL